MNSRTVGTLALVVTFLFSACLAGQRSQAQWLSTTASAPSEAVVWEVALQALEQRKFPVGAGVDPSTRVATTGWRNSLAPFKSEGYRQRARMRLEPLEGGKYKLYLQVERDTNEDLAHPMDLEYAKWEPAPDDVDTAKILISEIDARLGGALEIGKKPANSPIRSH